MLTHFRVVLVWKSPLGQIFVRLISTSTSAEIQKLGILKAIVFVLSSFWTYKNHNKWAELRQMFWMFEAFNGSNGNFVMVFILWLVYCVKGKEPFPSQHLQPHAGLWLAERIYFPKWGPPLLCGCHGNGFCSSLVHTQCCPSVGRQTYYNWCRVRWIKGATSLFFFCFCFIKKRWLRTQDFEVALGLNFRLLFSTIRI